MKKLIAATLDRIFPSRVRHQEIEEKWHVASDQLAMALNAMTPRQRLKLFRRMKEHPSLECVDASGMRHVGFLDVSTKLN